MCFLIRRNRSNHGVRHFVLDDMKKWKMTNDLELFVLVSIYFLIVRIFTNDSTNIANKDFYDEYRGVREKNGNATLIKSTIKLRHSIKGYEIS